MQPQAKYNFNEFISYLLPGSILIAIFYYCFDANILLLIEAKVIASKQYSVAIGVLLYFGASLTAGHICSVWTRWVIRPFLRRFIGNARLSILGSNTDLFYSTKIKAKIHSKFKDVFDIDMDDNDIHDAVPRLIRSYVLEHSSSIPSIRNHIVRVRSLSGNLLLPLMILTVIFCVESQYMISVLSLFVCVVLVIKQMDLDVREWKEIYIGFICINNRAI